MEKVLIDTERVAYILEDVKACIETPSSTDWKNFLGFKQGSIGETDSSTIVEKHIEKYRDVWKSLSKK